MNTILYTLLTALLMIGAPATAAPVAPATDYVADAWQAFDALGMPERETALPMSLEYVETASERPEVATVSGYFVLESSSHPGTFHVMRWQVLHTA